MSTRVSGRRYGLGPAGAGGGGGRCPGSVGRLSKTVSSQVKAGLKSFLRPVGHRSWTRSARWLADLTRTRTVDRIKVMIE
ncbi:hypothetical protein AQI95_10220 [Streptomyces yokosukanensis]|uniref:Transposase n=1 Tax=Streptomyces yokosukanensis TaxID=67386 RepID=A0A101PA74_9ACTN|nr:hypothetical protein AQI95_10220 [Streptomyces yokosukanensis]